MNKQERIAAFAGLGQRLREVLEGKITTPAAERLAAAIETEQHYNGWFTPDNVRYALRSLRDMLTQEQLELWLSDYDLEKEPLKQVAVIMAGNLPLVGFHDLLCILISGNNIIMRPSSDDKALPPAVAALLCEVEPRFDSRILIADGRLSGMNAVIATGSNNSSRYFEYYFAKYPYIIRKNRHSAAILTGEETPEQLKGLSDDIFRYFGLGCRSVSKVFLPRGYNFDTLFNALFHWGETALGNKKYMNNYDYNKAVYLLNTIPLLDNNFILLKEDIGLGSPAGVLFYEFYSSPEELHDRLRADKENLQCLVAAAPVSGLPVVGFGQTQHPGLADYADGVDTLKFLLNI